MSIQIVDKLLKEKRTNNQATGVVLFASAADAKLVHTCTVGPNTIWSHSYKVTLLVDVELLQNNFSQVVLLASSFALILTQVALKNIFKNLFLLY